MMRRLDISVSFIVPNGRVDSGFAIATSLHDEVCQIRGLGRPFPPRGMACVALL